MSKKNMYMLAAGAVLLVVVLVLVLVSTSAQPNQTTGTAGGESVTTSTPVTSSSLKTGSGKSSSQTNQPVPATQKYLGALQTYKNVGYYFQFVDCHAAPGYLTMKRGKKFMLDNRSAKSHKIAILKSQSFNIAPYDFAIATAPYTIGTYYITCDGGGTASILVQK